MSYGGEREAARLRATLAPEPLEAQYVVIYADYEHWWQRLWARLRRRTVLYSGWSEPHGDGPKIVWDKSGVFRVEP